jgi:hypothetical protein
MIPIYRGNGAEYRKREPSPSKTESSLYLRALAPIGGGPNGSIRRERSSVSGGNDDREQQSQSETQEKIKTRAGK